MGRKKHGWFKQTIRAFVSQNLVCALSKDQDHHYEHHRCNCYQNKYPQRPLRLDRVNRCRGGAGWLCPLRTGLIGNRGYLTGNRGRLRRNRRRLSGYRGRLSGCRGRLGGYRRRLSRCRGRLRRYRRRPSRCRRRLGGNRGRLSRCRGRLSRYRRRLSRCRGRLGGIRDDRIILFFCKCQLHKLFPILYIRRYHLEKIYLPSLHADRVTAL